MNVKLKEIILEIACEQMIKAGDLKPNEPESVKQASKALVGTFRNLTEEEIILLINRKCGCASKPVAGTRPPTVQAE